MAFISSVAYSSFNVGVEHLDEEEEDKSLEDKSVTIRDRDSMEQSRMSIQEISSFVIKKLKS